LLLSPIVFTVEPYLLIYQDLNLLDNRKLSSKNIRKNKNLTMKLTNKKGFFYFVWRMLFPEKQNNQVHTLSITGLKYPPPNLG